MILGAVAVELVHLGSLYHDDVMDEARTRRNVESVNARWGNLVAILAGDFLLARASEIAASLGTEVAGLLAATIGRLCEGQVRELSQTFDVTRTEESYLASIEGKTASLIATACRVGAITAGIDRARHRRAHRIRREGRDGLPDRRRHSRRGGDRRASSGKPAGNDLVEGVYTLPVIRALAAENSEPLRKLLGAPLMPAEVDAARTIVRADGAVSEAVGVARGYVTQSVGALTGVAGAGGHAMSALAGLGDHLIDSIPSRAD